MPRRKKVDKKKKIKQSLLTFQRFPTESKKPYEIVRGSSGDFDPGRRFLQRLSLYALDSVPYTPELLVAMINHPRNKQMQWILDTSFYLQKTEEDIWKALLSFQNRLGITEYIGRELDIWLNDPQRNNPQVFESVNNLKFGGPTVARLLSADRGSDKTVFLMHYYVNLIGFRKRIGFHACMIYITEHGIAPNQSQLSDFIKERFGSRAQSIHTGSRNLNIKENLLRNYLETALD